MHWMIFLYNILCLSNMNVMRERAPVCVYIHAYTSMQAYILNHLSKIIPVHTLFSTTNWFMIYV